MIYLFGRLLSARSVHSEDGNGKYAYACGEKVNFDKLKISVSYYRYLVYFLILDSTVLLAAFAALALHVANVLFFVLYLFIIIMSGLLLLDGGDR
ncbi:MAG: NADH-quinone oxidoreductase subunit A [Candidatus Bathycorpusculaceae bacterium]